VLPRELNTLARHLGPDRPQRIELHHLVGHDHAVTGLAALLRVPIDIHVHDYAGFCPRISLVNGHGRYCGEPADPAVCDACVAASGHNLAETIGAAALRTRSAADFAQARRIVVPSTDTAARLRRHFPALAPEIAPLEDDTAYPPAHGFTGAPRHVGIIGGIGVEKGYDVLLACARDAAARDLNLRFTVFGHTSGDDALLDTGRVFVTGPYQETEAVALIRHHDVQLAWQPSIWPETWCFTLGLAWRAGLHVASFDIGAPAERIRRTGRGWLMPLGMPPAAINSLFLGLRWARGLESMTAGGYHRMSNTV
jgi:glycosyltransferase involved in cell wall biosynthesis